MSEGETNSPAKIYSTFKAFGLYNSEAIRIIAGYFNESLVAATPHFSTFALLRLDGDTYESTIQALEVRSYIQLIPCKDHLCDASELDHFCDACELDNMKLELGSSQAKMRCQ